jgi:hypothetical protein
MGDLVCFQILGECLALRLSRVHLRLTSGFRTLDRPMLVPLIWSAVLRTLYADDLDP